MRRSLSGEAKLALFRQQVPETPAEPTLVRAALGAILGAMAEVEFQSLNVVDPAGLNVPSAPLRTSDTVLDQITGTMTVGQLLQRRSRFLNLVEGLKRVTIVTGPHGQRGLG